MLAAKAYVHRGSVSIKFFTLAVGAIAINLYAELRRGGHVLDPQFLMNKFIAEMLQRIANNTHRKNGNLRDRGLP